METQEICTQEKLAQLAVDVLDVYNKRYDRGWHPMFEERTDHVVGPVLEVEFPPKGSERVQLATMKTVMRLNPDVTVIQSTENNKWIVRLKD